MTNKTKVYRIGEYAIGGIIKVTERTSQFVRTFQVQALDWNTKAVVHDVTLSIDEFVLELNELTSCYYADMIMSDFGFK